MKEEIPRVELERKEGKAAARAAKVISSMTGNISPLYPQVMSFSV